MGTTIVIVVAALIVFSVFADAHFISNEHNTNGKRRNEKRRARQQTAAE